MQGQGWRLQAQVPEGSGKFQCRAKCNLQAQVQEGYGKFRKVVPDCMPRFWKVMEGCGNVLEGSGAGPSAGWQGPERSRGFRRPS